MHRSDIGGGFGNKVGVLSGYVLSHRRLGSFSVPGNGRRMENLIDDIFRS